MKHWVYPYDKVVYRNQILSRNSDHKGPAGPAVSQGFDGVEADRADKTIYTFTVRVPPQKESYKYGVAIGFAEQNAEDTKNIHSFFLSIFSGTLYQAGQIKVNYCKPVPESAIVTCCYCPQDGSFFYFINHKKTEIYFIDQGGRIFYPSICLYGGFKVEVVSDRDPASDVSYEIQEAFERKKKHGGYKAVYNQTEAEILRDHNDELRQKLFDAQKEIYNMKIEK